MGTRETTSSHEVEAGPRRRNRRQALALGGAAAVAATVAALGVDGTKKARAATGDTLILGSEANNASPGDSTHVHGSVGDRPMFHVNNHSDSGIAFSGTSSDGFEPEGFARGSGVGVSGQSGSHRGVEGSSQSGTGVVGESKTGRGVEGISETAAGVWGQSSEAPAVHGLNTGTFPGVFGHSMHGAGVEGQATTGPGVGGGSQTGPGVEGHSLAIGVLGVGEPSDGADAYGVVGLTPRGAGIHGKSETGRGVEGASLGAAPGVWGQSGGAPAVQGVNIGAFPGVLGHSEGGVGVEGRSKTIGVLGSGEPPDDADATGVVGETPRGTGVHGKSDYGAGVHGASADGPGVVGEAPGDCPGVRAESRSRTAPYELDGGEALDVAGKARFSTAGAGSIHQGQNSVFVPNEAVTGASHVTVTLTSDPGERQLHWVQVQPGLGGFTVHLTSAPPPKRPATAFTYLIVEPGGA